VTGVSGLRCVLGVNNCWAVKRYIEPEEWVEITATEFDVDYVQFSFDILDPRTEKLALDQIVSRTLDCCMKYGIKIHSCFTGLAAYSYNLLLHPDFVMRKDAVDWYEKALILAAKLKSEAVGGHMGAFSMSDFRNQKRRSFLTLNFLEFLKHLSFLGKRLGLKYLLWEPMPISREPPSTIEEAKNLLSKANEESFIPIKLCIDVGHACNPRAKSMKDLDPYSWLEELGADSPCVHLQQTDGKADRHWPFIEKYNKVGIIKGDKLISTLEKVGSKQTYLFLEIIHPFEYPEKQVIKEMKESIEYWKSYI